MKTGKPGKELTKGQKLIYEENQETIKFYTYVILGSNAVFYPVTLALFWSSFTRGYMTLAVLTLLICLAVLQFMRYMATAKLNGVHVVDAGVDLNMKNGMAEHLKDIILAASIIQVISILSNYFWFLLLIIPARLFHLLWVNLLGPWFFSPAEGAGDPAAEDKKQKKMDRKMRRQQQGVRS